MPELLSMFWKSCVFLWCFSADSNATDNDNSLSKVSDSGLGGLGPDEEGAMSDNDHDVKEVGFSTESFDLTLVSSNNNESWYIAFIFQYACFVQCDF